MSFNLPHRFARSFVVAAALAAATMLSGCQVRPLYAEASGTPQKLAAISFSSPRSRIEQEVRNHLIFLTSGGAGEAAQADYNVKLEVGSRFTDVLDDEDDPGLPGRVTVSATYTLWRASDGQVLKAGKRQVTSLIDIPAQKFAELRAIRDAENRASRELAEFIRADLAGALAREPQAPQAVTWQK